MKIRLRTLKNLIREALAPSPDKRATSLVSAAVDTATEFVDSLVAGSPDSDASSRFKHIVDQTASITKWMMTKREPKAAKLARFVKVAQEISDSAGFWKRPTFLGRDEYVDNMKSKLKKLQSAQVDVMSN